MKISGIYQIQSKCKPERIYIGSAININNRWGSHLFHLRNNKHHSSKLQRHFLKYGESDLQFSILLGCENEDLIKTEQYFIDIYNPYFNNTKTAGKATNLGLKFSQEHKNKMSKSHKGKIMMTLRNIPRSQEIKDKISKKLKDRKFSEETLHKMRIAKLGVKRSPEAIQKLKGRIPWNKKCFNLTASQILL